MIYTQKYSQVLLVVVIKSSAVRVLAITTRVIAAVSYVVDCFLSNPIEVELWAYISVAAG